MKRFRNHIPNVITLLNLASGAISVIYAMRGGLVLASWFILLAALFDFLDGFIARLLNAKTSIGSQLDSLADVVSFGMAPAMIFFVLLQESQGSQIIWAGPESFIPFASLFILLASAFRLARFNSDPEQEYRFAGLPTPASGLFVAALPMIRDQFNDSEALVIMVSNPYALLAIVVLLSWLMVSRIPMIAVKFRDYTWKENKARLLLLVIAPFLIFFLKSLGLALMIILYIILSVLDWYFTPGPENTGSKKGNQ